MLVLFAATAFVSAALLFVVQPLVARMVLPAFGGSPAVWAACMVFFQAALLAGYAYVHLGSTRLTGRRQLVVHAVVLAVAAAVLPIAVPLDAAAPGDADPVLPLLMTVVAAVGLPFFAVAASAPLLQRWYAVAGGVNPYPLYAASNAGSLVGLLGYPVLAEPLLTLREQAVGWTVGYGGLMALTAGCGWVAWQAGGALAPSATTPRTPPIDWSRRLWWVALAFAPSSLMLGVTTLLSTDLPPIPMLWVAPLALYLVTFVVAFGRYPGWLRAGVRWALPVGLAIEVVILLPRYQLPLGGQVGLHLTTFFLAALGCHGELADSRPPAGRLTEFYLWMSVGGALGGVFNALISPAVFNSVAEFPIALTAVAGLLPPVTFATPVVGRTWLGLAAGGILLAGTAITPSDTAVLYQERSFFGVSRVTQGTKANVRWLIHGRVEHGGQALSDDPARRFAPFLYYHPHGPIGQVFLTRTKTRTADPVGVVGLGCGSLAYYGLPGQSFTFYEIDPVVKRLAEDPAVFTYLKDCKANCQVVLGDARLTIEREADGRFGLLVIDAFTGDAIPVHLLTAEAVEMYARKLAPGGVIAFHISNNYFELEPVLAAVAIDRGLTGLSRRDRGADISEADNRSGRRPCHWVLLARSAEGLRWVAGDLRWKPLTARPSDRAWTDDYANVLGALRSLRSSGN